MVGSIATVLAPRSVLRAGINLSNFLLVSERGPSGEPRGVVPSLAAELAARLAVPLQLVPYKNPGLLADAARKDEWDVCFLGAEAQRAQAIAFTAPYVEIQATFLVPAGDAPTSLPSILTIVLPPSRYQCLSHHADSSIRTIADVDRPGTRIAVSARAACETRPAPPLVNPHGSSTEASEYVCARVQPSDSTTYDAWQTTFG